MKLVTASKIKELINVSRVTLYRWRKFGLIKEYKTVTGKIRYDESEILRIARGENQSNKALVYCRVSSSRQKEDLERQVNRVRSWALLNGISDFICFQEVASGLNSKRRVFNKVLDEIITGRYGKLIVEHKDRLTRFGFEFIERYCREHGCEIVIIDKSEVREDIVKDLIDIIVCFSSKLYGKRTSRNKANRIVTEDIKTYD